MDIGVQKKRLASPGESGLRQGIDQLLRFLPDIFFGESDQKRSI